MNSPAAIPDGLKVYVIYDKRNRKVVDGAQAFQDPALPAQTIKNWLWSDDWEVLTMVPAASLPSAIPAGASSISEEVRGAPHSWIARYATSLQRAIEYHCRGERVPAELMQQCPHHAVKLDAATALSAARIRELEEDAARYRWIAANVGAHFFISQCTDYFRAHRRADVPHGKDGLDAAIDAARSTLKKD
jgi:hypothetical protein